MMTRIEKWKEYREEIESQSQLLSKYIENDRKIKDITKQINNISPIILKSINTMHLSAEILSDNSEVNKNMSLIEEFSSLIDEKEGEKNFKEIDDFKKTYNKKRILNENDDINEEWMKQDKNYVSLKLTSNKLEQVKEKTIAAHRFKNDENFENEVKKMKNYLPNIENIEDAKDYDIKTKRKFYIFSFCVVIIMIVLAFIITLIILML